MGKYAEYMILGYGLAIGILSIMVAYIYGRYVNYRREMKQIERFKSEEPVEQRRPVVGNREAAQGVSMSAPASEET
jgi:hypothetical protein